MRVLITGITGFVGSHLAEFALGQGAEVYGSYRWRSRMENIEAIKNRLHLVECELTDAVSVTRMIDDIKPDRIFHLAAQSFVPTSWHAPQQTLSNNIISQLNIFEAIRGTDTRIQLAGSSEEYGLVYPEETPIKETNPLRPLSPYGVSKVTQDMMGYQYYRSYGIYIIRTRAFNHTGPRRGQVFVTSNFARQVAMIEKGLQEPVVKVGNLEARRDYTDVRDIIRGYWLSLDGGCQPGEVYNICSGNSWKIQAVLDHLLSLSKVKVKVEVDPERLRPSDVPILVGDSTRFNKATGWKPEIPIEKTLEDLLNYWRERV
ncbi:MAG: GDP-mannose 4,6-dehydratase [bacterium]|nr:GDP-mannose 4,6-dehydratase [bacterium]